MIGMNKALGGIVIIAALGATIFFVSSRKNVAVAPAGSAPSKAIAANLPPTTPQTPGPATSTPQPVDQVRSAVTTNDLPPQPQLANPPSVVKAIYLTGWVAGSPKRMQSILDLIKKTEVNTVIVDIKDYSGYVSYAMDVPEVKASGAENEIRIQRPNALIKELHDNSIYVVGRITDFQDPILAKAHPEWAMHNKATGGVWMDKNGLAWMDPAAKPVWDYLASIARDAFSRGFDEMNFDYIRFASDGMLGNIIYPYWDQKTPRSTVIASYFKFLRESFPDKKISADLFGLATVNSDDLGIGQVIQSAYEYFDYVSPMVYPSHYATGFLGYARPAAYPYEVINYSMTHALAKLIAMGNPPANADTTVAMASSTATSTATAPKPSPSSRFNLGYIPQAKLRPWLQDFDLGSGIGSIYTADMVRKEKQAVYDALDTSSTSQYYDGWAMWNAANVYGVAELGAQ